MIYFIVNSFTESKYSKEKVRDIATQVALGYNLSMKILFLFLLSVTLYAKYYASIHPISPTVKQRMLAGKSWHKGCPVDTEDLRYVKMSYIDFSGKERTGEMIVHKSVAKEVTAIFEKLYKAKYPIRQMHLVSDFGGSDWKSIDADNTSAFNCRNATGSHKWSKHSYGRAIDLNPLENPYISRNGHIAHKASQKFRKRQHQNHSAADRAVLLQDDPAVQIFKAHGWKWGGDWKGVKDYQHFSK